MSDDLDILERFVAYHDHIAVQPVPVVDDVRRGRRRVRRNRGLAAGGAALAVAAVAVGASLFAGNDSARPQPIGPPPPSETTTPDATSAPGWTGPLRENGSRTEVFPGSDPATDLGLLTPDARDAAIGAIDIRKLRTTGFVDDLRWSLELRKPHPRNATLASQHRTVEYGVVIDGDGDQVADCEIGINNDAPNSGDYRVWVTNLRTGVKAEQVGGPYGYPIDFGFTHRDFHFFFLGDTPDPCDPFSQSASFYTWSSVTDDGRVTAWDYAPDTAWLAMRPKPR
jgi:hypothetical protein